MELELKGNIIGVISSDFNESNFNGKVKEIVLKKASDALKMVGLDESYLELDFEDLSQRNKSKVILASKLQDKEILEKGDLVIIAGGDKIMEDVGSSVNKTIGGVLKV